MNGIMVWAWMLFLSDSSKDERKYGLGTDAQVSALKKRMDKCTELRFGHGCSGKRTHEKMNGIMRWAWRLWSCMDAAVNKMVAVAVFRAGCKV